MSKTPNRNLETVEVMDQFFGRLSRATSLLEVNLAAKEAQEWLRDLAAESLCPEFIPDGFDGNQ